jgi:hypothetical protein
LIILDWDDTLFPTSHLNPVDESQYDHLAEKYKKLLAEVEDQAIKLLQNCLKESKVVIVTNAKKGWVEYSSSKFMPRLHSILMKFVRVISARVEYEDHYPTETMKWKELAFQKLWHEKNFLEKGAIVNLIAIGDSEFEMEAAKKFAAKSDRCTVKLLKLRDSPSFDELTKELEIINERFQYVFSAYKNISIKLER